MRTALGGALYSVSHDALGTIDFLLTGRTYVELDEAGAPTQLAPSLPPCALLFDVRQHDVTLLVGADDLPRVTLRDEDRRAWFLWHDDIAAIRAAAASHVDDEREGRGQWRREALLSTHGRAIMDHDPITANVLLPLPSPPLARSSVSRRV